MGCVIQQSSSLNYLSHNNGYFLPDSSFTSTPEVYFLYKPDNLLYYQINKEVNIKEKEPLQWINPYEQLID